LQRLGAGLGIWIWLPVLALLVLFAVIASTPSADCDGSPDDLSAGEGITLVAAVVASLGALAAAAGRLAAMRRRAGIATLGNVGTAVAAVVVVVLLSTLLDLGGSGVGYLWSIDFAGVLATAAALLALVVAWMLRRKPAEVGILLPLYLLGAALFVYPGFALLAIGLKSGAFC
jgi:hypothetical protein